MKRVKFNLATDARRRSREAVPRVPGSRVIPDKRRKPIKHPKRESEEQ